MANKKTKTLGPAAFASVLTLVSAAAMIDTADAAIYLKIEGIKGESQQAGYKDSIDIMSWSWAASSQNEGRKGKDLCISGLSLSKAMDVSTAPMLQRLVNGEPLDATLIVTRSDGDGRQYPYLELLLSPDTTISNYAVSDSGFEPASESLTLTFSEIEGRFKRINSDGRIVDGEQFFAGPGNCN